MKSTLREARATLALAFPIIVGQVSQMLIGITDNVMIGRVGPVPLAAAAFTHSVFTVFYIAGIGLLLPVAVLVSRDRGIGRERECAEWLRHGLAIAALTGLGGGLALAGIATQLHRFGQPPEVVAIMKPFFLLIAASLLPALLFQVLRQFAESLGRPWVPMGIMLLELVVNASLNWMLIHGRLGAPALGLTGAGVGTWVARSLGVVLIVLWLRRDRALRPVWPQRWRAALVAERLRAMLRIGVPAAGMLLFEVGAFGAAALMMGWIGTTALAAHQIALSCAGFTFMFPLGLSMAVSMRISQAYGEGRRAALRPIGFGALAMSSAVMGGFALLFALAGEPLARLFVHDEAVVLLAARLLVVASLFQLFDGSQVVGSGALRGLGDVRVPAVITFIAYWVIALPGGYLFGVRGIGPEGVWIALASGLAFAALLLGERFARLARPAAP